MADHGGIELQRVEPRLFGWIPPLGLLSAGFLLLLVAIALLALADWVLGPLLLVLALLLLGLYAAAARHLPPSRLSRGAAAGVWRARDELRLAGTSCRAWTVAGCRMASIRHDLRRLGRERDAAQHELGGAVYRDDDEAAARLRSRMQELDAAIEGCTKRLEQARHDAHERVAEARLPLSPTEITKP